MLVRRTVEETEVHIFRGKVSEQVKEMTDRGWHVKSYDPVTHGPHVEVTFVRKNY